MSKKQSLEPGKQTSNRKPLKLSRTIVRDLDASQKDVRGGADNKTVVLSARCSATC